MLSRVQLLSCSKRVIRGGTSTILRTFPDLPRVLWAYQSKIRSSLLSRDRLLGEKRTDLAVELFRLDLAIDNGSILVHEPI